MGISFSSHLGRSGAIMNCRPDAIDGLNIVLPTSRNSFLPERKQPASMLNAHLNTFSVAKLAQSYNNSKQQKARTMNWV